MFRTRSCGVLALNGSAANNILYKITPSDLHDSKNLFLERLYIVSRAINLLFQSTACQTRLPAPKKEINLYAKKKLPNMLKCFLYRTLMLLPYIEVFPILILASVLH